MLCCDVSDQDMVGFQVNAVFFGCDHMDML